MAKQLTIQSGVILLVIAITTAVSNFAIGKFNRGQEEGTLKSTVSHNTEAIHRIDTKGCGPSQKVLQRLEKMDAIDEGVTSDIQKVEERLSAKIDKLEVKIDRFLEAALKP